METQETQKMKKKLIQKLSADLCICTKTVKSKLDKVLSETEDKDGFISKALIDTELYIALANEIKSNTQTHKNIIDVNKFPYIIPTTEIFTKLFDTKYLLAKRENQGQWYAYFQSADMKEKFSFKIPEQMIAETELSEKYQNPFHNPQYKLFYIGLCSLYGAFDKGVKQISVENLYRLIYGSARNINQKSLQNFIQQMDEFLKLCRTFNNSFECYYYNKKDTQTYSYLLSFKISRDTLIINDVPCLLNHARSRKRVAGVNRSVISSGKAETMLQRLYIAYRWTLAKNQNNRMSANIESSSIQTWCGCSASEKVVNKSFIFLQQQKQIREFSISRSRLGFKIEVIVK